MTTHVLVGGAYGSAGVAAARRLADCPDVRLTLVDDGDPGGGLCILRGCMPSKEVLSTAEHRFAARHDHRLAGPLPEVDLESVVATKDEHTTNFAGHRRAAVERLAERDDVEFVHDTAEFVGDRRVRVGGRTLEPDYAVIATGSTVNPPSPPGIDDVPVTTSADVLDATSFGDSGVVVGFGYVGLELVPYLSEVGVDLTVIEHDARPLDEADPPFGDALLEYYREAFDVEILTETYEKRVEPTEDGGVRLDAASHMIEQKGLASTKPDDPHGILRNFRRFVTKRKGDAVLLGEVDVEPDHLGEYFGDGDELDTLYNFVLNNYLFLALARENAESIVERLRLLPPSPAEAQWVNFLRNLDELDLERLTVSVELDGEPRLCDLFADEAYDPLETGEYEFDLGPYGYRWLRVGSAIGSGYDGWAEIES
jgi:hypothetical protein